MNSTSTYRPSRTEKLKQIEILRRREEVRELFTIMGFTIKEDCFLASSTFTSAIEHNRVTIVCFIVLLLDIFFLVFVPYAGH